MESLAIVALVAGVAVAALLITALLWWVAKPIGSALGLDRKIDRFLDVDGDGLSAADRLKFQEQHPRGGSP